MTTTISCEKSWSPYDRDNVRKGIGHYVIGRGMSGLAGLASVVLLARFMDMQSYAGYTALTGLMAMGSVAGDLGLQRAVARYVPEGRLYQPVAQLSRFIWTVGAIRAIVALLLSAAIAGAWPYVVGVMAVVKLAMFPPALACFLIGTTLFQHFSTVLQALVLQRTLTRILIVQWAGRLAAIAGLIAINASVSLDQALWIMAVPEMLGVGIFMVVMQQYLAALRSAEREGGGSAAHWPSWKEVDRLALHNYGYNLLAAPPQGYVMRMLVAALLPVQFVASYGFFQSLVEKGRPYLPLQLMYNLAEPVLIAGYVRDKNFSTLSTRAQLLYKANFVLLLVALVFLAAAAADLTTLATGGRFSEYAWLLSLLLLQVTVGSHALTLQLVLNAVKQSAVLMQSGIIALMAMGASLCAVALAGRYEYLVFTPLVFEFTNNTAMVVMIRRRGYPYRLLWTFIGKLIVFAVATYACVAACLTLVETPFWRVLAATGIVVCMSVLAAASAYVFKSTEMRALLGVLKRAES